mmetsp:Transcript_1465/g.6122  ORF Transcript_1465/g.6122 Transcript_1465/m.6122 type:complete len:260 (+) Transcript_1465:911-1690(+)
MSPMSMSSQSVWSKASTAPSLPSSPESKSSPEDSPELTPECTSGDDPPSSSAKPASTGRRNASPNAAPRAEFPRRPLRVPVAAIASASTAQSGSCRVSAETRGSRGSAAATTSATRAPRRRLDARRSVADPTPSRASIAKRASSSAFEPAARRTTCPPASTTRGPPPSIASITRSGIALAKPWRSTSASTSDAAPMPRPRGTSEESPSRRGGRGLECLCRRIPRVGCTSGAGTGVCNAESCCVSIWSLCTMTQSGRRRE